MDLMFNPGTEVPEHLVYVQWYTSFSDTPDPNNLMYKIWPLYDHSGGHIYSIVPLANIRRSIHLFPKFVPIASQEWASSNVLDLCQTFFVNDFTNRHVWHSSVVHTLFIEISLPMKMVCLIIL